MVNQAALKAAMDGSRQVTMAHMEFARDKVLMGPAKKSKIPDKETNLMTAYHEAGHTLVAFYTKDSTPLHKVTIVPRGMSLGHVSAGEWFPYFYWMRSAWSVHQGTTRESSGPRLNIRKDVFP